MPPFNIESHDFVTPASSHLSPPEAGFIPLSMTRRIPIEPRTQKLLGGKAPMGKNRKGAKEFESNIRHRPGGHPLSVHTSVVSYLPRLGTRTRTTHAHHAPHTHPQQP